MHDIQTRIPQAYCYARVSDKRQADRDESIPGQIERCENYYNCRLKPEGVQWQGAEFDSFGVSASKRTFTSRPAGIRLMQRVRSGDHLIFDKPDRVWRSLQDFCEVIEEFKRRDINVHFVSLGLDTSTPMGMFALQILVAAAELEAKMNGLRQSESIRRRRRQGKKVGPYFPIGTQEAFSCRRTNKAKYLEWDPKARAVMAEIVRLRVEEKLSFAQISTRVERTICARTNRPFSTSVMFKRVWTPQRVEAGFYAEVYYRDNGITDVCDIPPKLAKTAKAYCESIGVH